MALVNNNNKKENIIFILFKAKPKNQTLTVARYNYKENGKWQRYHISSKINAESWTAKALCDYRYYVNWGVDMDLVTYEELVKIIKQTNSKPLCEKCAKAIINIEERNRRRWMQLYQ